MKPIIKVENLSKRYQLGGPKAAYGSLRETLSEGVASRLGRRDGGSGNHIWALKDVNFEVLQGEVLGVVGSNGAGKSTLLKILSRITEPTSGRVELYGRVGSLLEVGTGFHPELTGRENIYLSGAILGMPRRDIQRRFDEVVAFSEIEKFLDTPVKRYSSGMYVRLAFSVAAHMAPDILLVDEVLAVGDVSFQKKCMDHMRKLKQSGMTILLVSHNLAAIQRTCERSLYINTGMVTGPAPSTEVVKQYRADIREREELAATNRNADDDSSAVLVTGFEMSGRDGISRRTFEFGEEVHIRIDLRAQRKIQSPLINFGLRRADGVVVCNFNNWIDNFKIDYIEGNCTLEGWLPPLRLIPHYYEIYIVVWQTTDGGDLGRLHPLAVATFGDFNIEGPPLTDQDGVFQMPATKWVLTTEERRIEYTGMGPDSVKVAFEEQAEPVSTQ